ncbi:MAG: hypothetical protein P1V20_13190 [Verrucomicrobiales bacterium]|nr:hypothetical protein [Verrucomicrobiales bacterium]
MNDFKDSDFREILRKTGWKETQAGTFRRVSGGMMYDWAIGTAWFELAKWPDGTHNTNEMEFLGHLRSHKLERATRLANLIENGEQVTKADFEKVD